jgi:deoxyribose-phosphate aldolase
MFSGSVRQWAKFVDHSILAPTATPADIERGIDVALKFEVASVCTLPHYVSRLSERLEGSTVRVSTTIGFPHGGHTTRAKLYEAEDALDRGCHELDVVVNIGRVLAGDHEYVRAEVSALTKLCHERGQKLKLIFETCYLSDAQKIELCHLCGELSVDWVKTSTGFGPFGATVHDVQLLRQYSPLHVAVKASGGVSDLATLVLFHGLGATRVGLSRTAVIFGQDSENPSA